MTENDSPPASWLLHTAQQNEKQVSVVLKALYRNCFFWLLIIIKQILCGVRSTGYIFHTTQL